VKAEGMYSSFYHGYSSSVTIYFKNSIGACVDDMVEPFRERSVVYHALPAKLARSTPFLYFA